MTRNCLTHIIHGDLHREPEQPKEIYTPSVNIHLLVCSIVFWLWESEEEEAACKAGRPAISAPIPAHSS